MVWAYCVGFIGCLLLSRCYSRPDERQLVVNAAPFWPIALLLIIGRLIWLGLGMDKEAL